MRLASPLAIVLTKYQASFLGLVRPYRSPWRPQLASHRQQFTKTCFLLNSHYRNPMKCGAHSRYRIRQLDMSMRLFASCCPCATRQPLLGYACRASKALVVECPYLPGCTLAQLADNPWRSERAWGHEVKFLVDRGKYQPT